MKRLVFCFTVMAAMLGTSSCNKLLQPKVYGEFTSANFPKTQADVQAAIVSFYSIFRTDWGGLYNADQGAYPPINSLTTDEAMWVNHTSLTDFTIGAGDTRYTWMYSDISYVAKMTQLLGQLSDINTIPEEIKASDIAEIKTLRAWLMYILYDLFGPVPVKLDPSTLTSTTYIPRPTDAQYSGYIENDLKDAISTSSFPDRYNNDPTNWGRVSKGVARMLLLKLYMHNKEWKEADSVGHDIMNMGYSLMPNYADVFSQSMNNEIIYAIPTSGATRSYWIQEVLPADPQFGSVLGIGGLTPGWGAQWMPWSFYDTYQPQDTRLNTIANSYMQANGNIVDSANGLRGAIPLKYITTPSQMNNGTYDVVVFRYADVLLSIAEAINNQEDMNPSDAIPYLKMVTDRANETIPTSFTRSSLKEFILAERGRELYDEGFRRSDLIRNGEFIPYANQRGINAQSYQVLFPIPSYAIIQSNGVVKQNPGY